MKTLFNKARNEQYDESDVCMSIIARFGTGGNNMPVVLEDDMFFSLQAFGDYKETEAASALKMRDYKDATDLVTQEVTGLLMASGYQKLGTQEAMNGMYVVENGLMSGVRNDGVSQTLDANYFKGAGERNGEEREVLAVAVDCRNNAESEVNGTLQADAKSLNSNTVCRTSVVRRLTPLECERLQGFPSEKKWDVEKMTKDEYIAWNLAEGNIIADADTGKVYRTRGPGGKTLNNPKEMVGTDLNGYKVVAIRNGSTKLQCRVHRIIWISQHGIIPEGYCIDHINGNKTDNRIENLQLLTPAENSTKAKEDGLYPTGLDNHATKLDPDLKDEIAYLYQHSDVTQRKLSEIYGISKSRINQIIKEIGWTDIGDWTDSKGKKHKDADSPRYKALGNSIALPYWKVLARRISAQYDRDITMGSLFDGIGGFVLAFEHCGAKAIWASEIDSFCIAVTKKRFGDDEK